MRHLPVLKTKGLPRANADRPDCSPGAVMNRHSLNEKLNYRQMAADAAALEIFELEERVQQAYRFSVWRPSRQKTEPENNG
jgi:hypothetical protein